MESTKSLPAYEMKRLDALLELQKKYAEEHAAFVVERKALELKYIEKYNGLTAKRAAILSGAEDPAADVEGAAEHKGVDGFWLQAMQNMRICAGVIEKDDEPALKALQDVVLEYLDDFAGFRLVFKFAPNDYFEDATLTKTVHIEHMMGSDVIGQEPSVDKLEGCEIHWKADKNLTVKTEKVTTRKKGKKVTTVKEVPQESFFRFFETVDLDEEVEDNEEMYEKQMQMQMEAEMCFAIRNKLVPRAAEWFTGEAVDDDSDDEYDDEDDEDDYDEEDDEEEEEDDDDEEEEKPKAKRGGKGGKKPKDEDDEDEDDEETEATRAALASAFSKGAKPAAGAPAGDKPQECKQQ